MAKAKKKFNLKSPWITKVGSLSNQRTEREQFLEEWLFSLLKQQHILEEKNEKKVWLTISSIHEIQQRNLLQNTMGISLCNWRTVNTWMTMIKTKLFPISISFSKDQNPIEMLEICLQICLINIWEQHCRYINIAASV